MGLRRSVTPVPMFRPGPTESLLEGAEGKCHRKAPCLSKALPRGGQLEPAATRRLTDRSMRHRRFPRPWRSEPIPAGYCIVDANGLALANVYGQPPNAVALSDKRLTAGEAEKIARLIARLPGLVELERDRNKAHCRRKPQPLRSKPVTIGDLVNQGKLLEVHCGSCRPARHLYIDAGSLDLPKRLPVPEVANHLVCSVCGARNTATYHPIWARPDA